jgi:hypothetical protein
MSLVLHGRECSKWGCRPKPHPSLRSLVAARCFKSLGFRYAPVVFLRATQKTLCFKTRVLRGAASLLRLCFALFSNSLPASPTAQTFVLFNVLVF